MKRPQRKPGKQPWKVASETNVRVALGRTGGPRSKLPLHRRSCRCRVCTFAGLPPLGDGAMVDGATTASLSNAGKHLKHASHGPVVNNLMPACPRTRACAAGAAFSLAFCILCASSCPGRRWGVYTFAVGTFLDDVTIGGEAFPATLP